MIPPKTFKKTLADSIFENFKAGTHDALFDIVFNGIFFQNNAD